MLRLALARCSDALVRLDLTCTIKPALDVYLGGCELSREDMKYLQRAGWLVQSTDANDMIFRAFDSPPSSPVEVERLERYAVAVEASRSLATFDVEHVKETT